MLSFSVFDDAGDGRFVPATDWDTADAHLFGPDGIPVPAEIRFEDGRIVCEKASAEAAGLSTAFPPPARSDATLPVGAEEPGLSLVLATCLVPERPQPYLLSLEFARQRLMTLLNKLEDWQLFDLAPESPAMTSLEAARLAFTEALVSHRLDLTGGSFSSEAERMARRALALAVDASDALVRVHAERAFRERASGSGYLAAARKPAGAPIPQGPPLKSPNDTGLVLPGKPAIAASVNPSQFSPAAQQAVATSSDFLALPLRWRELEPDEGRYSFTATDRWIEWAVRRAKMQVFAGPVISFSRSDVPDWLYIWEHDYETLREVIYEHVKNVITRYRRTVPRWTVLSGLNRNENVQLTFEQMMDLTRMAMLLVRKLHPQGKMQIEVDHPSAGQPGHRPRALPGFLYAEMVQQAGIGVDSWAVRLELQRPQPGEVGRDLMQLSAALDRYALLDRPLSISAIAPAVEPGAPAPSDEDHRWLQRAFEIIVSKPSVVSLTWHERDLPPGAKGPVPGSVIDATGGPKASIRALGDLRRRIREVRSDPAMQTGVTA